MGFLDALKSIFGGSDGSQAAGHRIYVRCNRCGEIIETRVDLISALTPRDEGGYMTRKTLVGNRHCFERIEVTLYFDKHRNLIDQEIIRGRFVPADEIDNGDSVS